MCVLYVYVFNLRIGTKRRNDFALILKLSSIRGFLD